MPPDMGPGPNRFTRQFLQQTWEIIWSGIMKAFDAPTGAEGEPLALFLHFVLCLHWALHIVCCSTL
jgi:hypothetical protein